MRQSFHVRTVAWRNNSQLRYVLSDHLGSTRGEANQTAGEAGQRRYLPFGGDRPVSGASDLGQDERYTGQKRIESGGGAEKKELYCYGARWYLPGVGIFTQPDTIVPDSKNPQALNRFVYGYNNPMKYNDPSGHEPGDALTVAPVPTPTPGPSGTPAPSGPVPSQSTALPSSTATAQPVAAPTPAPNPTPSPSSGSASPPGPSMGALLSKGLIETFGSPKMMLVPSPMGMGQIINSSLGIWLGELGGGKRSIGPDGNLVYENLQGIAKDFVKSLSGDATKDNAVTLGNVIVNSGSFDRATGAGAWWMAHEHAHTGQSGLLGSGFLPTYIALWALSGGDHSAHPLEKLANDYAYEYQDQYIVQSGQIP